MAISAIGFLLSFIIPRTNPTLVDIRKLSIDTFLFLLVYGYTLWYKKYQQLIGLSLGILLFNIDLLERGFFECNNFPSQVLKQYSFLLSIIYCIVFLPTLTDKYQLKPLTNRADINDVKITGLIIASILVLQVTIRAI